MASSEGDQLLAGAFHAITDKVEAKRIYFKLQRGGIENEYTFSERFKL